MSEEKRSGLLLGVDPVDGVKGRYTASQPDGGGRMDDDDGGGDGDDSGDNDGGDGDQG